MLNILVSLRKPPAKEFLRILAGQSVDIHHGEPPEAAVLKKHYDMAIVEGTVDVLKSIKNSDPRTEVILLTEKDMDVIAALKEGASAVFTGSFDMEELKKIIHRTEGLNRLRKETHEIEGILSSRHIFNGVVGRNPHMLEIFNFITRIAPYYKTVTITGETGTGKEVLARALHAESPVKERPFVVFNCGGVVETLVEAELFGHKKGAFTGAVSDKAGLFEAAGEGAIFLDEVGELPVPTQSHLLRVLQDGEFRRIGSNQVLVARCRVIAATNRDLSEDVKRGRFRDDLFFRLTPLTIQMPPLRERKDDIPFLLRALLKRFSQRTGKNILGISRAAQAAFLSYNWPGNVRELENVIERAGMLAKETFIRVDDLPQYLREKKAAKGLDAADIPLEEAIKGHIEAVLKHANNNRTKAAKILGISRRSLIRKIEKYSIK
ncbi:MAG TPA: sigma-54 dependent transcriptional regulator [Thermodesulfobacteriota bacterium]|nr:sigma-54 dependent transcriptional regulator [Thermodesulfobacteriota bacterium]